MVGYTVKQFLKSYDYLRLSFVHCYFFFVASSDKMNAPVSLEIILKDVLIKISLMENMSWNYVQ